MFINLEDVAWNPPFRGGRLMFSRKTQPLDTFSKTFSEEQELCGLIRMGFFLKDRKRLLIVWIGATKFLGQLKRTFFMPFFLNSCSRIFLS